MDKITIPDLTTDFRSILISGIKIINDYKERSLIPRNR